MRPDDSDPLPFFFCFLKFLKIPVSAGVSAPEREILNVISGAGGS